MDWKLELVVLPVADIDRAKEFYVDRVGFVLDVDHRAGDFRVVQMTPPGSACSISIGTFALVAPGPADGSASAEAHAARGEGGADAEPPRSRVHGLHLVVNDIEAARAELVAGGVDVSGVFHFEAGNQVPGPAPERRDYESFLSFADPDGNGWVVQEVGRAPSTG
jgi:catechol 2,3-dioxygenase-like lactoylglutathione lyase family enzyme